MPAQSESITRPTRGIVQQIDNPGRKPVRDWALDTLACVVFRDLSRINTPGVGGEEREVLEGHIARITEITSRRYGLVPNHNVEERAKRIQTYPIGK